VDMQGNVMDPKIFVQQSSHICHILLYDIQQYPFGKGYSSGVECLPGMCEILSSIPKTH
jgi:hypothetical protein